MAYDPTLPLEEPEARIAALYPAVEAEGKAGGSR
jgi:hypothetical protein